MKNKATTKNKVLFSAVLAVFLLAFNMSVQSAVELPNGIYHETVDDLVVKVMGGFVKAQRTWYAGKWHHNRAWNNLQIEYNALDGSVSRLGRNYDVYEKSNSGIYTYADNTKSLSETETGYRWTDKHGNWIDYAKDGRIIKYGDRNNVEVSFIYDAEGHRTGVKDHFGNQVLWYEYNAADQVISVRDQADPAQARIVKYQYTDGLLTQVIDVLGNTWSYSYKWTKTDSGSSSLGTTGSSGGASGISTSRMDYTLLLTSRTDPEGRTFTIEYNPNKRVASVKKADGTGPTYEYGYDKTKKEYYTRETQSSGRIDETWFNKDGEVIRRDVNGNTIETIRIEGDTHTHTDERGNQIVRYYDSRENLLREVYPDGMEKTWQYGAKYSNILKKTDERGIITRYEYDDNANLIRKIEAEAEKAERIIEYTYDEFGNRLTQTRLGDARTEESETIWTYDSKGNIETKLDPEGKLHRYAYTVFGKILEYTDPRGETWRYTFDDVGQLLTSENPLGHTTRIVYDKVGNLVKRISPAPENYETTYKYDVANRLTHVTDAMGGVTEYQHDSAGRMNAVIDASGRTRVKQIGYDTRDNIDRIIDGADNMTTYEYGPGTDGELSGQLNKVMYPTYIARYKYDARGRRTTTTDEFDSDSRTTQWQYDATGNLTTKTDAANRPASYEYDALGRLVSKQDPIGGITTFTYDDRDNLISVTNARGVVIYRYEYDRLDRLTHEVRPNSSDYKYTYDTANSTVTRTDALGQKILVRFDAANRPSTISYYATGSTSPDRTTQFSFDAHNRLTGYNDGTTDAVYEYDALNRKTAETLDYGSFSLSYDYSYDAVGRKIAFTGPDGATTNYKYDVGGHLVSIMPAGSGSFTLGNYQWNKPTQLAMPGGGKQSWGFDGLMRPTRITATDPAENTVLDYQYSYNVVDNIISRTTEHGSYQYDYDDLDRLIAADNPTLVDEQYSYDLVGNRLTSASTTGTWQYSDADELLAYNDTQLKYDANGSLIQKTVNGTVTHYEYTLDNRLKRVYRDDGALDVQYGYDPFGRRLWKESDGQRRYFFYAEEGLIAEAGETGNIIRQYGWRPDGLWGTDPFYLKQNGQTYYYHNDHFGTPQKLVSASGQVVWEARYAAFGQAQAVGTVDNPLRYPGQYYDGETGLHYNNFRYYEPEVGRYITNDPVGLSGGVNVYAYVEGNPINSIDPYGLVEWTCIVTEGGVTLAVGWTRTRLICESKCIDGYKLKVRVVINSWGSSFSKGLGYGFNESRGNKINDANEKPSSDVFNGDAISIGINGTFGIGYGVSAISFNGGIKNGGAQGVNHGITGGVGAGASEYKGKSKVVDEEKIKCDDEKSSCSL